MATGEEMTAISGGGASGAGELSGLAPRHAEAVPTYSSAVPRGLIGVHVGAPRSSHTAPAQQPPQLIPTTQIDLEACVTCGHIFQMQCDAFDSNELLPQAQRRRTSAVPATEAVLARDSDAVASVVYPEQTKIGLLLSTADGGSSMLCYFVQAVCVGYSVFSMLTNTHGNAKLAGMVEPNTLMYVNTALWAIPLALGVLVVSSARDALHPGGVLQQLKVGEVTISEQDDAKLSRWRVGLGMVSVLTIVQALLHIVAGVFSIWFDVNLVLLQLAPDSPPEKRVTALLFGVMCCTAIPVGLMGWWTSMYTASCLCRDDIVEVIKKVRSVEPSSDKWNGQVAQPVLELIDKMKLLSNCWSGGLVGIGGVCWLWALAVFVQAINEPWCKALDETYGQTPGTQKKLCILMTVCMSLFPFLLAKDVADTSTWCENLMEELNDARSNHGPESHLKIQWLETTLKQLVRSTYLLFASHT